MLQEDELKMAIALTIIFVLPFIISISSLIRARIEPAIIPKTIFFRIIAWGSAMSGFAIVSGLFIVLSFLKPITENTELAVVLLLFTILLFNYLIVPESKILEIYRSSTSNYPMWQTWIGRNAYMIVFASVTATMGLVLYYYVLIPL